MPPLERVKQFEESTGKPTIRPRGGGGPRAYVEGFSCLEDYFVVRHVGSNGIRSTLIDATRTRDLRISVELIISVIIEQQEHLASRRPIPLFDNYPCDGLTYNSASGAFHSACPPSEL